LKIKKGLDKCVVDEGINGFLCVPCSTDDPKAKTKKCCYYPKEAFDSLTD
jgi:hypothetical protein